MYIGLTCFSDTAHYHSCTSVKCHHSKHQRDGPAGALEQQIWSPWVPSASQVKNLDAWFHVGITVNENWKMHYSQRELRDLVWEHSQSAKQDADRTVGGPRTCWPLQNHDCCSCCVIKCTWLHLCTTVLKTLQQVCLKPPAATVQSQTRLLSNKNVFRRDCLIQKHHAVTGNRWS